MARIYSRCGVWYSDILLGGKRLREPLSRNKSIAQSKLAEMIRERDAGRYSQEISAVSWGTFKAKHADFTSGAMSEATRARNVAAISALEKFFIPAQLTEVTAEVLERWKSHRKAQGRGNATINRDISAIKAMLRKAEEWGYRTAPIKSVKKLRESRGRLIYYTPEELGLLFQVCHSLSQPTPYDWETIAMLGARAGLRRAEIYWLSWHDVDLKRELLSVTGKDGWRPKSGEFRHIPIADDLLARLQSLPRATRWVIGQRPSLAVLTTVFRRLVAKAGIRGGLHTLRHTFASHLAQAGVPLLNIARMLGHSDVKMTQIYAHLCPASMDAAIAKLPSVPVPECGETRHICATFVPCASSGVSNQVQQTPVALVGEVPHLAQVGGSPLSS